MYDGIKKALEPAKARQPPSNPLLEKYSQIITIPTSTLYRTL